MNRKILTSGTALVMLALSLTATGYHIDGGQVPAPMPECPNGIDLGALIADGDPADPDPDPDPFDGGDFLAGSPVCFSAVLTSADWTTLGSAILDLCESNGPFDDRNSHPAGLNGVGGLCTTGRNDASGEPAPTVRPGKDTWTRLDVCDATTVSRNNAGLLNGAPGPYVAGGEPCASGTSLSVESLQNLTEGGLGFPGRTDQHSYVARVGAFTCFVPTGLDFTNPILGALTRGWDFAFYYRELYAWWSYDGDGYYTVGDAPGVAESGDGDTLNNDDDPMFSDGETAFHGHAVFFIDTDFSAEGSSVAGSAETKNIDIDAYLAALDPDQLNDDPDLAAGSSGAIGNTCDESPSNPPSGQIGPAFIGPNLDNPQMTAPLGPTPGGPTLTGAASGAPSLTVTPGWSCVVTSPWAVSGGSGSIEVACSPVNPQLNECKNAVANVYYYPPTGPGAVTGTVTCGASSANCMAGVPASGVPPVNFCTTAPNFVNGLTPLICSAMVTPPTFVAWHMQCINDP